MAVYFLDLDGTLFVHSTDRLLPGADEFLRELRSARHTIVFTTRRSAEWPVGDPLNDETTVAMLAEKGIEYDHILFGITSPRILINDDGAVAYEHLTNARISGEERLRWLGGRPVRGLRLGGARAEVEDDGIPEDDAPRRLDAATLLRPISLEVPGGPDLRWEASDDSLQRARALRTRAAELSGEEAEDAWLELLQMASGFLAEKTKDLELAVFACEALLALDGPAGLAEGLAFTRELCDAFWPSLHPGLEDDGEIVPEIRVAPLGRLSAASFDATMKNAPLARGEDGRALSWRMVDQAGFLGELMRTEPDRVRALLSDGWTSPARLEKLWDSLGATAIARGIRDVKAAAAEAKRLEQFCDERLGEYDELALFPFRAHLLDIEEMLSGEEVG